MLEITKADRAGIGFHFFNIKRVDCKEVKCKLAVTCGKFGELLDCILFVLVLGFEQDVQFLPQSSVAPIDKQAVIKPISQLSPKLGKLRFDSAIEKGEPLSRRNFPIAAEVVEIFRSDHPETFVDQNVFEMLITDGLLESNFSALQNHEKLYRCRKS